jgi:ComF family protein
MFMLNKITGFILDTLFPLICFSCGKAGEWICEECFSKIPLKIDHVCPLCEKKITPAGRVCFACRKISSLDGLLVAASYKNEIIPVAVHNYKYRFVEDLHLPLGKILVKSFLNSELSLPDLIIPVPLHKRRLRYRGFNQAELLAEYLGANLTPGFTIPFDNNIIVRHRYTSPQMKIKNYSQRKKNLENAFIINKEFGRKVRQILKNKRILLVDDIATTGATLFECAKVLKNVGAKEVFAIVIARQEIRKK